jgi:23S rRNA pseudouridine2605 synthase
MKFFERAGARLYPVGRLDYLSEGLLVITNDGELANGLTRAANKVEKTYLVKVSGQPREAQIEQLRSGIMIDRGRRGSFEGRVMTQPARIRLIRKAENPWYEMVLTEGRNRELRKMFEEVGHHVEKIRRVGFGPLVLDVPPGEFRELSEEEVLALRRAAKGEGLKSSASKKQEKKRRPQASQLPRPAKHKPSSTKRTRGSGGSRSNS